MGGGGDGGRSEREREGWGEEERPREVYILGAPSEDVKLKDRDVVVECEVDGGLERHGLQRGVNGVGFH